jgi:hypothetical protein
MQKGALTPAGGRRKERREKRRSKRGSEGEWLLVVLCFVGVVPCSAVSTWSEVLCCTWYVCLGEGDETDSLLIF